MGSGKGGSSSPPDAYFEYTQRQWQETQEANRRESQMLDMIDALQAQMAESIAGMGRTREIARTSRASFQAELDAKYSDYVNTARQNAVAQAGQSRQRDMWLARRAAEDEAVDFVDKYLVSQRSQAALTGRRYDISDELRTKLISGRLADIWSAEYENTLQGLVGQYGALGSARYQRGQAGMFAPEYTNLTGLEIGKVRQTEGGEQSTTLLLDEDDDQIVLGGPTLLGG